MTPRRRQALAIAVMLAILIGGAAWSVDWMLGRRQAALRASGDLAACQELARAIESLRQKPRVAATEAMGAGELGQRIQAASRQANMGEAAIEGIYPQPPHRLGESPYVQKPTALALRGVSLPQLAAFLYHLSADGGLSVRDLRLRSPRSDAAQDTWDAEVTVTVLVYAPPAKGRMDS